MEINKRWNSPTPPFFRKARVVGMVLAAAGGAILTAPVTLPALIVSATGYAVVAGSVLEAVSQVTVEDRK